MDEAAGPAGPEDEPELTGPERLCAVSRTVRPIAELIRFGAGLDGVVVPDLARKLPGRGVWVTGQRAMVADAVKRNVFAKSLKRPVRAPADLAERIEAMMLKRVIEALALANKAGLVTPGFAKVEAAIAGGDVMALVHGSDGAPDGVEKLNRKFIAAATEAGRNPEIVVELTIEQISLAIGRANVVHAAILSGGAAVRLLEETERLMRYRTSPAAA